MLAPIEHTTRPITLAILAMGGEGGGVLADWIVDLAEHAGYLAQMTSVPGVAQRTGATIYYLEMFPRAGGGGRDPVLALMPVPGDVDIVIASELMEAGRAIQRGLVTPDRTTLIASTSRAFAMTEKIALADGRVDDARLIEACRSAARTLHAFDMAAIAEATGSVISAVLLGALAGAGVLPFPRTAFEAAIRRGGVGVSTSLAAFTAGFEAVHSGVAPPQPAADAGDASPARLPEAIATLVAGAGHAVPPQARALVRAGVLRAADYQDIAYARVYLDRLMPFVAAEQEHGDASCRLLQEVARQLALAMAYEDTIRVAELKIRPSRFERVRQEVKLGSGQILEIAEFMHPRTQEIADTLPAPLGRWLLRTGWARRLIDRTTASGRTVRTTSLTGFLLLYALAALKPLRPRSLRFGIEQRDIDVWLATVLRAAETDYALAVEVAAARTLVKGYGDTHARGRARFDRLVGLLPALAARPDAADRLARLRNAANADESGEALEAAIAELAGGRPSGSDTMAPTPVGNAAGLQRQLRNGVRPGGSDTG
jgi:indolepyruvate ferredoxin oxidoreductase, beta subunit